MWQSSAVSLAEYKTIVGTLGNGCPKSLCFAGGQCILLVLADMCCTFLLNAPSTGLHAFVCAREIITVKKEAENRPKNSSLRFPKKLRNIENYSAKHIAEL